MNYYRLGAFDATLLLLIFLLPSSFQLTPPAIPIGDFYITVVEISIFALLFRWLLALLVNGGRAYRSSLGFLMTVLLAYLGFCLFLGASRFGFGKALADFRSYLPLLLYFWAIRFYGLCDDLSSVRNKIFDVMAIVAIYVLIAFLFFRGYLDTSGRMSERVFFDNTLFLVMIYGGYLLSTAVEEKRRQFFVYFVLILNFLMLLVMQVRSYWVAFAFVVAATMFMNARKYFRSRFIFTAIFLSATIAVASILLLNIVPVESLGLGGFVNSLSDRMGSIVNIEETLSGRIIDTTTDVETIGTRVMTAKTVWEDYFLQYPVFGLGFGGEIPIVSPLGGIVMMKYQIDNGYLTVLAKIGVVGALLCGFIILKLWRNLYFVVSSPLTEMNDRLLARSFLIGIVAILISSVTSSVFIRQQPALLALIFMLAETEAMRRKLQAKLIKKNKQPTV